MISNTLDSNLQCYQDSPLLDAASGSAVPSHADRKAGLPPPPPYTTMVPAKLQGFLDELTGQILIEGCFRSVGPPLGPNVFVRAHIEADSLQGFVHLWAAQPSQACDSKIPKGEPLLWLDVALAPQSISSDWDG